MKIGILVHGLFLQAKGWDNIVWGSPPHILGALPMTIEIMLRFGLKNIRHIIFGTGASEKDGLKEAEYTNLQLRSELAEDGYLEVYPSISEHPSFRSAEGYAQLSHLLQSATLEVEAKNTMEEIVNAAKHFTEHNCELVIHIPTCGSHGPRCAKTCSQAKAEGRIPQGQIWMLPALTTTFEDSTINDVAVIEAPHRTDDPMLNAPVKAHEVASRLFKMSPGARMQFLVEADRLLRKKYGV